MCAPSVLDHSPLGGLLVAAYVARKPLPTFTPPLAGVRLSALAGVSNGPDLVSHNQLGEVHVGVLDDMAFALGFSHGGLPLNDFLSQFDLLVVRAREAVAGDVLVLSV